MATTHRGASSSRENRWIGTALRDFPSVHLVIGLFGNADL